MKVPKSMMVTISFLALGFFVLMVGTIRANGKRQKYQSLSNVALNGRKAIPTITSYQDSAAVYALPSENEKKDVTFCVIDGRLVDNR
jgi:hypothetical protein